MKRSTRILALALVFMMLLSAAAAAATPPAKPSGEGGGGGSAPSGGSDPGGSGGGSAPGGGSSSSVTYNAVYAITSDTAYDGVSISSSTGDENVVDVSNGAAAVITDSRVTNTGSGSGGDNSSFYGVGASLLVRSGSLYVDGTTINTSGTGNAGVFAYSSGTAYVNNTTITTSGSSAGGLHVAGGGTLYAWNCNVTTSASSSSAAIRSDRGGGTMVIDGGTYNTTGGTGAVYVTADITVHNATLISGASEAVAMEGRNTLRLFDCSLSGTMTSSGQNSGTVSTWGIILYQSMSGDSEVGTAVYEMDGGDLSVTTTGPLFYTTNTSSVFTLRDVAIKAGSYNKLLVVAGNDNSRGWGTGGSNGAACTFTAYDQALTGDIAYDSISSMNLYLLDGTALTGAIVKDDSLNGGHSGSKTSNVTVGSGSTWTVTGNSTITGTLYNAGTIENAKIVNTSGKTLATFGSGTYTVTVGAYSTTANTSGAGQMESWSSYAVTNPFEAGTVPSISPTRPSTGKASWVQGTDGTWTYVTAEGDLVTGWLSYAGSWYYLDPDNGGVMVTGTKQIGGQTYYFLGSGAMYSGWNWTEAGFTYYCDNDGDGKSEMLAGTWAAYNGSWYYFDDSGIMATGVYAVPGDATYYFAGSGAMNTGSWLWQDGKFLYFGADGRMISRGWAWYAGGWYYFAEDGTMASGLYDIAGDATYSFSDGGRLNTNCWLWDNGSFYYFGSDGRMVKNGWALYNGSWYYFDETGAMASGVYDVPGDTTYCFADSGAMQYNYWLWQDSGFRWFGSDGRMVRSGWVWYGGSWYYMDENGTMVTGTVDVPGCGTCEFDSDGIWIGYAS